MKKVSLVSICASHYRKRIYLLMEREFNCNFIFGVDKSTVKRLDTNLFSNAIELPNRNLGNSHWYYESGVVKKLSDSDIIVNDLGIFCLSAWKLLLVSKFRKQKVYNWDHGWYGREGVLKKWIKRAYFGLADGALIYGNYARDLMIKNGFNGEKLHVIHNSLDYDSQLLIRNRLKATNLYSSHFGNNNPALCFIGRLTPVKKLDQVLKALHLLNKNGVFCNLVFIGDGSEMNSLEGLALSLGLNKQVWFYVACYDEETNAELIYNADLCVAPGNIGLTAMHSMMFGCPCISHNDFCWQMPEFEAIHEGETVCFFKRDDINSLASTISKWLEEKGNKRQEVREACFKEIDENWNPHKQIKIIKSVIYG